MEIISRDHVSREWPFLPSYFLYIFILNVSFKNFSSSIFQVETLVSVHMGLASPPSCRSQQYLNSSVSIAGRSQESGGLGNKGMPAKLRKTGRNINEGNKVPFGLAQRVLNDLIPLVKRGKCIAVINLD